MARRYSNILQSARLRQAADRYIEYLQGTLTRPSRVGTQGAREATQPIYVYPFGFDLGANQVLRGYVNPSHYADLSTYINGVTGVSSSDTLGTDEVANISGFSPARVVWFRNATRSVTVATSDITGLEYLKYNGDRSSCPFGRDDAASTSDMYDAFQEIKGQLLGLTGFEVNRVSLTRERLRY